MTFALFNLPLMVLMYTMAAYYHFCFDKVKGKHQLLITIESSVVMDRAAIIVKKKTKDTFQQQKAVTDVLRMMLLLVSVCYLPSCFFQLLVIAMNVNVMDVSKDIDVIATARAINLCISPMFGVILFLSLESGFHLHSIVIEAFKQKIRACRYKLCGPPTIKKKRNHDDDEDDDDAANIIYRFLGSVVLTVIQLLELLTFSIWGLVMWVPMEVFKHDIKQENKQMLISALYLLFLLLPPACFLNWVPSIFDAMGDSVENVALKAMIGNIVLVTYLTAMFAGVAWALWISRRKPSLNFVAQPRSHVRKNFSNLQLLATIILEGVQLSSLLLTHPAFVDIKNPAMLGESPPYLIDFEVLKLFVLDMSVIKAFDEFKGGAFKLKLYLSMLGVAVWVLLVTIPAVVDNIRLQRSTLFSKIYLKFQGIQSLLAGPGFLIILDSLLATMDCGQPSYDDSMDAPSSESGAATADHPMHKFYMEDNPEQACWESEHFMYATLGLVGLIAYVPLAALTMVEDYDEAIDIMFIPIYFRCEVLAKGLMAFTMKYTDGSSPFIGFPVMAFLAAWMLIITKSTKPCCIFWINHIKMAAFAMQLWTAVGGLIVFSNYEHIMAKWGAVPVPPALFLASGWVGITLYTITIIKKEMDTLKKVSPPPSPIACEDWSSASSVADSVTHLTMALAPATDLLV